MYGVVHESHRSSAEKGLYKDPGPSSGRLSASVTRNWQEEGKAYARRDKQEKSEEYVREQQKMTSRSADILCRMAA